jgi:hypothetical protein
MDRPRADCYRRQEGEDGVSIATRLAIRSQEVEPEASLESVDPSFDEGNRLDGGRSGGGVRRVAQQRLEWRR